MSYKPTIFFPVELIDKINAVIQPIERVLVKLVESPAVARQTKKQALNNLNHLADFRRQQHEIIQNYNVSSSTRLK